MTIEPRTRDRIGHLYDYLCGLAQEVYAKPVRHVGDHEVAAQPSDLPDHPSVAVGRAAGDAWLRVAKTPRPKPPDVPAELSGLVCDDPYSPPSLPEPSDVLDTWMETTWLPWAESAKPAADARALYETLFRLRQRMRTDEATHELVWGHGVLGWRFAEQRICHPLLVTPCLISFEEETGELSVVPDGLPTLELDCLQGLGVPGLERLAGIADALRTDPPDVWSDADVRPVYRRVLAPLGLDDRLEDGLDLPAVGEVPVLSTTWRFFLRRRRVMFLRFFERLKGTVTAPVVALAAGEEAARQALGDEAESWGPVAERLLMPLAANDEQEQIARKLAAHSGVTVQGPPGTGKSHTIANLVSHLVAHGKRVLVTAHKDQALAVLRDKIPAELRDLSLAVLGSSSADLTALQRSVQAITAAADNVDEARETVATAALAERLAEVERDVLALRARLRRSLEREQESFPVGGHLRRATEVAAWLAQHERELGHIPDPLPSTTPPPLSSSELTELHTLVRRVSAEAGMSVDAVAAWSADLPPANLPPGSHLAARQDEIARLDQSLAAYQHVNLESVDDKELEGVTQATEQAAERLAGLGEAWLVPLRAQVRQGPQWSELWSGHARSLREGAAECARLRSTLAGARIELPKGVSHQETVTGLNQLRERFQQGKRGPGLVHRALKQFAEASAINGEPPQTVEDLDRLLAFAELRRLRVALVQRWEGEVAAALGAPHVPAETTTPETWIDQHAMVLASALDWELVGWPRLRAAVGRILGNDAAPVSPSPDDLRRLASALAGLRAQARRRALLAEQASLGEWLTRARSREGAGPLWSELPAALQAGDWRRWDGALAMAVRLRTLHPYVVRYTELSDRLATVAPRWVQRITETGADPARCGDPSALAALWEWRQAETWLRELAGADDLDEIQRRLGQAQEEQRRLTLELTRRSAWLATKRSLGHSERQALVGWLQTLRKIGRGTGVSANKWRAEAQRLMPHAMGAVPVWIMPYYRVAESFDPAVTEPFDVVIVDESSQCDVFAIGLLGLGRKVVVVGDDKQISPSAVGVNRGRVDELIRAHLRDFPNALLLDLESSLYDASSRLFPGVVRLREHFRCLPRIIEFSSQHYYGGEIQPLREETTDRLPGDPVPAVHVPDGVRVDTNLGDVNEAEADALVDRVVQCCADPAYEGRTMGVISLLSGSGQARFVDERLLHKLGPEEYERRRMRCGDPYSFQGDERDVVFVSVVADDDRGPFTSKRYEQRVNVAASRARDQMWVFHSVMPHELHPEDERAKLIRYAADGLRSADLGKDLEARCESEFERRVLRMLLARGYLVTPQHPVGNLRIDLVVRGAGRKLAIECDGDRFHGPDQWEDDLRRQRVLERLGWRFWRVRGSAFFRDPERATASLWPLLDDLGIRPGVS